MARPRDAAPRPSALARAWSRSRRAGPWGTIEAARGSRRRGCRPRRRLRPCRRLRATSARARSPPRPALRTHRSTRRARRSISTRHLLGLAARLVRDLDVAFDLLDLLRNRHLAVHDLGLDLLRARHHTRERDRIAIELGQLDLRRLDLVRLVLLDLRRVATR